jgi:hypothetical protein
MTAASPWHLVAAAVVWVALLAIACLALRDATREDREDW